MLKKTLIFYNSWRLDLQYFFNFKTFKISILITVNVKIKLFLSEEKLFTFQRYHINHIFYYG